MSECTHSLGDIAKELNRSVMYLRGLQSRFELPISDDDSYSDAYLAFLRTVVYLRILGVSEEALRVIWLLEKKLLRLLNLDSTGTTTWFLDACGQKTHRERRLLLSNYDLGVKLTGMNLQPGLDFSVKLPEFFEGKEMGEDATRVLRDYLRIRGRISADMLGEIPLLQSTAKWAARIH